MAQKPKIFKECFACKKNGYAGVRIDFIKIGDDPITGKSQWQLVEPDGTTVHKHVTNQQEYASLMQSPAQQFAGKTPIPNQGQQTINTPTPQQQQQQQTNSLDTEWIKKELNELHRKLNVVMEFMQIPAEEITPPNDPQDTYDQH